MKKALSVVMSFIFAYFLFYTNVFADSGHSCKFCKEGSKLCETLCKDGECRCYLIYVAIVVLLIVIASTFVLLFSRHKRKNDDEMEEYQNYQDGYHKLMAEKERRDKIQKDYEAKMNGEEGYEDMLLKLVTSQEDKDANEVLLDFLNEKNINPDDVSIEIDDIKKSIMESEEKK